jgi:FtsZ-binding cell division protein ZapB
METELSALEDKVRLAAELCQQLRTENIELRQRMAQLANDKKRLEEKVSGAKSRLESLLARMPE